MFPPGIAAFVISPFLSNKDLIEYVCTNQDLFSQLQEMIYERKAALVDQLIYYFYYCNNPEGKRQITIQTRYDTNYYSNVRSLFHVLPEIFHFIESHKITHLNLGCTTSYGGYAESPYRMITEDHDKIREITTQLLTLLSHNTTLIWCNLGLFQFVIGRKQIIDAVEHHPVLDSLNMSPEGATTRLRDPPHHLWRNRRDRTFYWDHWRHDDAI